MTPEQEAAFERKAEKHFRSHRDVPSGRNFRFWEHPSRGEDSKKEDENYRKNFDRIFPNAPGAGY